MGKFSVVQGKVYQVTVLTLRTIYMETQVYVSAADYSCGLLGYLSFWAAYYLKLLPVFRDRVLYGVWTNATIQ